MISKLFTLFGLISVWVQYVISKLFTVFSIIRIWVQNVISSLPYLV